MSAVDFVTVDKRRLHSMEIIRRENNKYTVHTLGSLIGGDFPPTKEGTKHHHWDHQIINGSIIKGSNHHRAITSFFFHSKSSLGEMLPLALLTFRQRFQPPTPVDVT